MNKHKTEYPIITTDIGVRGDTGIRSLSAITIIMFLAILALGVYMGSLLYNKAREYTENKNTQPGAIVSDNTEESYILPKYDAVMSVTSDHKNIFFKNTSANENIIYVYNVYEHETKKCVLEDAQVLSGYAYEWDIYDSDVWTDTFIVLDVEITIIDKTNSEMIGVEENVPVQTITVKKVT